MDDNQGNDESLDPAELELRQTNARSIYIARLEKMLSMVWAKAAEGDLAAVELAMNIAATLYAQYTGQTPPQTQGRSRDDILDD